MPFDNEEITIPSKLMQYQGCQRGTPAPGERVSVDVDLHQCQRPISIASITKWAHNAKEFDWNLFGYVTVVELKDGTQKLINGQHRRQLQRWLLPDIKEMPAHIVKVTDDPKEADRYASYLFTAMNGVFTKKITPEDNLWAGVVGELDWAMRTKTYLDNAKLACGRVNEEIHGYTTKRDAFERSMQYDPDATVWATQLIKKAAPNVKMINGQVLKGLTRLVTIKKDGERVYEEYMWSHTNTGKTFEKWFVDWIQLSGTIKVAEFGEYKSNGKNGSLWENGVAYGLVSTFRKSLALSRKEHLAGSVGPAKAVWQRSAYINDE